MSIYSITLIIAKSTNEIFSLKNLDLNLHI